MAVNRRMLRTIAAVLYVLITALVFAVSDPAQAGAMLFVVPIALLAISDGMRGGTGGAAVAATLLVAWVLVDDIDLEFLGWAARLTAFATVGALVGGYAEQATSLERRRVERRYATELHDRVLQSLVLARYSLPQDHEARRPVDDALQRVKALLSDHVGDDVQAGDLRLSGEPPPDGGGGGAAAR